MDYKDYTGDFYFRDKSISNAVVFCDSNVSYCITTGHSIYSKKFDAKELNINDFKVKSEKSGKYFEVTSIITDLDFAVSHDIVLLKLKGGASELSKLKISTIPTDEFEPNYNFRGNQCLSENGKKFTYNAKDGLSFRDKDPENANWFFMSLNKELLRNHLDQSGSEWMEGYSGSPLFIKTKNTGVYLVGLLRKVPNKGDNGQLIFVSPIPLKDYLPEIEISNFSSLTRKFKKKRDFSIKDKSLFNIAVPDKDFHLIREVEVSTSNSNNFGNDTESISFSDEIGEKEFTKTTFELLPDNDLLFLIGNPGQGKTTVLKKFVLELKEDPIYTGYYLRLNNFTDIDKLSEYIGFDKFQDFDDLIVILDGLDEMPNPTNFISKLDQFIREIRDEQRSHRFIISCRTNTFLDLSPNLGHRYKTLRLVSLKFKSSLELFEAIAGQSLSLSEQLQLKQISHFLNNPWKIRLIAGYYSKHQKIESNLSKLWEEYIDKRLVSDREDHFNRIKIHTSRLKESMIKMALINEFCNSAIISDDRIYSLLGDPGRIEELKMSPFLEMDQEKGLYFEEKQIQEYFVASLIREKESFDTFKEVFLIQEINAIRPTLVNVFSFLINIVPQKSHFSKKLLEWINDGHSEMILKFDPDRVEDLREEYFVILYQKMTDESFCKFSEEELAYFGNTKGNFVFLINVLSDTSKSRGARLLAFRLLKYFNVHDINFAKKSLFEILNSYDFQHELEYKREAIHLIKRWKLVDEDHSFIQSILEQYMKCKEQSLNLALLRLIAEGEDIDIYFKYIVNILNTYKQESTLNNPFARANDWLIQVLILKTKKSANFLELGRYSLYDASMRYDTTFNERIVGKTSLFLSASETFLDELISDWYPIEKDMGPTLTKLFYSITTKFQLEEQVFFKILNKYGLQKNKWFLAKIINRVILSKFIEIVSDSSFGETKELLAFCNVVSYEKLDLALELQSALFGMGIISKEDLLPSKSERVEFELLNNSMVQENFDSLFETQLIISKLEVFFESRELDEITQEKLRELELQYYKESQQWFYNLSLELVVLRSALRYEERATFASICNSLQDSDLIKLTSVNAMLKSSTGKKPEIVISHQKKEAILSWLGEVSEEVDFTEILIIHDINEFSFKSPSGYRDYLRLELIYDFLDLELEYYKKAFQKEFFLDSMSFYNLKDSDPFDEHFSHMLNGIEAPIIEERIRKNLESLYFSFTGERQMVYAMNNQFKSIFPLIREYLIESDNLYPSDAFFDLYMQKTDDYQLMSEISERLDSHRSWEALSKLLDREDKMYEAVCRERILGYLKSEDSEFKAKAISLLLRLGDNLAMDYLLEDFELYSQNQGVSNKYSHDYKLPIEKLRSILTDFFTKIYVTLNHKDFEFQHLNAFFLNTITNSLRESVGEEDRETNSELINRNFAQIREGIESIDIESLIGPNSTSQIKFYHKNALSNLELTYIDLLSKPMSFVQALKKTREIFA